MGSTAMLDYPLKQMDDCDLSLALVTSEVEQLNTESLFSQIFLGGFGADFLS